jgi:predicted secreted protein
MSRKLVVLITVLAITICCVSGCKKQPAKPESMEQYKAEAAKEINKDNMAKELGKVEKDIDSDLKTEQK